MKNTPQTHQGRAMAVAGWRWRRTAGASALASAISLASAPGWAEDAQAVKSRRNVPVPPAVTAPAPALPAASAAPKLEAGARPADYIVAVVNSQIITAAELTRRQAQLASTPEGAGLNDGQRINLALNQLVDDRLMLSRAAETGLMPDAQDLDQAEKSVAEQNRITLKQLRDQLARDGQSEEDFRAGLTLQMVRQRLMDREVTPKVQVTDRQISEFIVQQKRQQAQAGGGVQEINVAQMFFPVPAAASDQEVRDARDQAARALAQVKGGEDFAAVARRVSQDSNRDRGGEIGLLPVSQYPKLFADAVASLKPGDVAPELLRSPEGFHVLRLIDRRDGQTFTVTQTRSRHILIPAPSEAARAKAIAQLQQIRKDILAGKITFAAAAQRWSQDGSKAQGGELGWTSPGQFVPEFEKAENALKPGEISEPVVSRFGVHLIQVEERRQAVVDDATLRTEAAKTLREREREIVWRRWLDDLRSRAYIDLRQAPR
ncbi:peptidylprolyl isomerase [Amphibiibacter pelophylacis]|uniref:Peptidylprolyl isomerase n=1 Tax=Amphibiibacter pelophylacis TaxID=1799477 RepID=A0ACC6NZE5_9BURK